MPLPKPDVSEAKIEVLPPPNMHLGEGPHWDEGMQKLIWVNIYEPSVFIFDPATNENKEYNLKSELERLGAKGNRLTVGVAVPIRDDPSKLLLGTGSHIATLDLTTGTVEYKNEFQDGHEDTRYNDGKCDPRGRFWAGSMDIEKDAKIRDPEAGSLYLVDKGFAAPKQEITKVAISNGLAWSADCKTMYYIDTIPATITAYDYDIETGSISNPRSAFNWDTKKLGMPDGMTIDSVGRLWIASYSGRAVHCCDPTAPDDPAVSLYLPEANCITSCCFGGKNLDELYITSANKDDPSAANAGKLFRVTNLGVTGTPCISYSA